MQGAGGIVSDSISSHAAQEECPSATCMRRFAEQCSLWAPSTFFDKTGIMSASEPTWASPNGTKSRIDFIPLPQAFRACKVQPWVDPSIVLRRPHEDHFPVRATWARLGSPDPLSWPPVPRDPDVLDSTQMQMQALQLTWSNLPMPAWSVDVHQHTQFLIRPAFRCSLQIAGLCTLTLHRARHVLRLSVQSDKAEFVCRQTASLAAQKLSHDH